MNFIHFIKKFYFIPLAISMIFVVSCQNNEKKDEVKDLNEPAPEMTLEQKKAQFQNVAPQQSGGNATASGNINPPHGQPGHRCDIPVGAPLDGGTPAQTDQNKQIKMTPTSSNQSKSNAQSGEKPAVNPPHGQPFHRCDVKVGDPLP